MKELSEKNYDLKSYKLKGYLLVHGLYYDDTLLCYGGYSRIQDMCTLMNGAFLNGIAHSIVQNS